MSIAKGTGAAVRFEGDDFFRRLPLPPKNLTGSFTASYDPDPGPRRGDERFFDRVHARALRGGDAQGDIDRVVICRSHAGYSTEIVYRERNGVQAVDIIDVAPTEREAFRSLRCALRLARRIQSGRPEPMESKLTSREIGRILSLANGDDSGVWIEDLDERLYRLGWIRTDGTTVEAVTGALDTLLSPRGEVRLEYGGTWNPRVPFRPREEFE